MLGSKEYYSYVNKRFLEKNHRLFAGCSEKKLFERSVPEGIFDELFLLLDIIQRKYEFDMQTMCIVNYNQFVLWQQSNLGLVHYEDMLIAIKFMVFCCLADKILDSGRFCREEKEYVCKKLDIQVFFSDQQFVSDSFVELDELLNDVRVFLGSERVKGSPYYEVIAEKIEQALISEIYMARHPLLPIEMHDPNKMMLLVDKSISFETAAFLMASISHSSDKMAAAAECIGKIFWMADDLCDFVDDVKNRRRNSLLFYCTQKKEMRLADRVEEAFANIDMFINELEHHLLALKKLVCREMYEYVLNEVWEWCSDIRKYAV